MAGRVDFVQWLMERGADLDPVSAYRLGWIQQLKRIAKEAPEKLSAKVGNHGSTVLHMAVLDADMEMIQTLLDLGADPSMEDDTFNSPPIGWAREFSLQRAITIFEEFENLKS